MARVSLVERRQQPAGDRTHDRLLGAVFEDLEPLSRRVVARMQQEMSAYAGLRAEDLLPGVSANLELILPALQSGRPFSDEELAKFATHGESRAEQGVAIEELLRGWRLGTQALVDEMVHRARVTGVDESMVLDLTRSVLSAADVAVVSAASGHRQAELRSDRQDQRRRAELVRGTLFGTLRRLELRAGLETYGLDPDREYRALRAVPTPERPAEQLEQQLGLGLGHRTAHGLVALIDGDLCGFVASPPTESVEVPVGIGPATTPDALAASFRLASRAASTAAAFGLTGVHDLARLGLLPAVLADDAVGEEMVRHYVAPISQGSSGTDVLETVQCYLDHGMRVDRTASALFVHQNTVRYRLSRFEQATGADLHKPGDILEVWWSLQRHRLARSAAPPDHDAGPTGPGG
jgi:hypothetical protein